MLNLTYEHKLDPTESQVAVFEQWLEICRKVYNFALADRKDWVNSRKCRIDCCSLQLQVRARSVRKRDIVAAEVVLQRGLNSSAGQVEVNSCGGQAA